MVLLALITGLIDLFLILDRLRVHRTRNTERLRSAQCAVRMPRHREVRFISGVSCSLRTGLINLLEWSSTGQRLVAHDIFCYVYPSKLGAERTRSGDGYL